MTCDCRTQANTATVTLTETLPSNAFSIITMANSLNNVQRLGHSSNAWVSRIQQNIHELFKALGWDLLGRHYYHGSPQPTPSTNRKFKQRECWRGTFRRECPSLCACHSLACSASLVTKPVGVSWCGRRWVEPVVRVGLCWIRPCGSSLLPVWCRVLPLLWLVALSFAAKE